MKSKAVWVVVSLILGALGSGLWELAIRPIFAFLGTAALDVVTLGLESARNSLYEEVAHGQYERATLSLISAGVGLMAGATTTVLFRRNLLHVVRGPAGEQRRQRPFVVTLLLVFTTTMMLLLVYRVAYVNRAANYFERLSHIVAPLQTDLQRVQVRSQFAQVTTREEFVKVIDGMRSLARANNLKVPDFTIY
ncbi:hypothetical protein [Comamonas sp. NoAH]|uniref:hypothetical protein n=1 Tax=Comamonas halotolerans TaxID=3041496 RepID=UPI0024E082ED|nr:hypothetical protein [Comamonas sp. NoAH]